MTRPTLAEQAHGLFEADDSSDQGIALVQAGTQYQNDHDEWVGTEFSDGSWMFCNTGTFEGWITSPTRPGQFLIAKKDIN